MNYLTKKLISILAIGLVPVALSAIPTSVQAQNPQRSEVRVGPVQGKINPALIHVNKRPAISFEPFKILDPTNGKPISRDTLLPPLPNGKTLTAGQYYDELNKLEQQFNALGYSLRNREKAKVELQTTPVPLATLQEQKTRLNAAFMPNTKFQPLNLRDLERQYKATVNPQLSRHVGIGVPVPAPRPLNTVHKEQDWNYTYGDTNVFSASIQGKFELNGTSNLIKIDGEANAGCSIFSQSFDLLRVTANLNAPSSPPTNVKVGVSVGGTSVYSLNQNIATGWTKTDSLSKTLDESMTHYFTLGGIPMSAKFGATGTAGIGYWVGISPLSARAHVGPFVHTKVYAQVGIDLLIAEAGAGANLTLLNTDGNLSGSLSLEYDPPFTPHFDWSDSYSQSLDMLSGDLYIYAKISYPCWGWPPWCTDEYDWTVVSWPGFQRSGYLFNDSGTLKLW